MDVDVFINVDDGFLNSGSSALDWAFVRSMWERCAALGAWSRTQQSVSLTSAEAELYALSTDDWNCRRDGDERTS